MRILLHEANVRAQAKKGCGEAERQNSTNHQPSDSDDNDNDTKMGKTLKLNIDLHKQTHTTSKQRASIEKKHENGSRMDSKGAKMMPQLYVCVCVGL